MESGNEKTVSVMLVGLDDSEHSYRALQWTLEHFFSSPSAPTIFKLIVVHAKPTSTSVVGLAGAGAADVLPFVESDLTKVAARVLKKAKDICLTKLVEDVQLEMMEGDPRNVLCEAVDKFHADMLIVGSHGYGAIKRAILGSVSDYCAHHAHCTVMIVKKPKHKH